MTQKLPPELQPTDVARKAQRIYMKEVWNRDTNVAVVGQLERITAREAMLAALKWAHESSDEALYDAIAALETSK